MKRLSALALAMVVLALGAYTYYTIKQSKYVYSGPVTIQVVGKGEVFAKPDVATFSFTVDAKESDATTAQNKVSETMEAILAYLKEKGIDEKDVKTSYYNLNPRYEYPQTTCTQWGCPPQVGEPTLIGYEVSQSVSVKVRDTAKAGEVVSGIGEKGALNVSGLSFTIDDEDTLMAQAREKAISDAQEKAQKLAGNLGTRIVRMTGYWEDQGYPMPYGVGGDDMSGKVAMMESVPARPAELPMGENTITATVNISYEVR
ncbi:MAG TPA: SIMPL domain-containing protein [Candidatus Paceibacterota bacterium]|nr:SIMPL domain-containing protein [Candidatus Paceibacterota bacterium]